MLGLNLNREQLATTSQNQTYLVHTGDPLDKSESELVFTH